jgi:uncharacterized protein
MPRLLVYTRTTGYRHACIPAGVQALRGLGGFAVDATEEFPAPALSGYAAIVFLSTSGTVLDEAGRDAFMAYLASGGSWLGIHGASTTEYEWPWFEGVTGARFAQHPAVQAATVSVEDHGHPATSHLPARWARRDEWYDFRSNPRQNVHVLLTVDESSYCGGTMGADHPVAWCHTYGGGRCLYTALGHTPESFSEPAFVSHLRGALEWLTD